MTFPSGIPVMLDVAGRRCVIVGGGSVAARRAKTLAQAGAQVIVVAPRIDPQITALNVEVRPRGFEPADLDGAFLAVVATDQPEVNEAVDRVARERGVLINRTDEASKADLTFMSAHRDGPLTLAVHTAGASASAAVRLRDELAQHLDADWAVLLSHAHAARKQIQQLATDPAKRRSALQRLTDEVAMEALKSGGESALEALYADIMEGLA